MLEGFVVFIQSVEFENLRLQGLYVSFFALAECSLRANVMLVIEVCFVRSQKLVSWELLRTTRRQLHNPVASLHIMQTCIHLRN